MSLLIVPPSFDDNNQPDQSKNPCADIPGDYPAPQYNGENGHIIYQEGPIFGLVCKKCEDIHMLVHVKDRAFADLGNLHWSASDNKYVFRIGTTGWDCFENRDNSWQYAKVMMQGMLLRSRAVRGKLIHQKQIVNGQEFVQIGPFSITIFSIKIECTDDQMKMMILNKVMNMIVDALDN